MKYVFLVITSILVSSCSDVSPVEVRVDEQKTDSVLSVKQYLKDGEGSLFNDVKWYSYQFMSHTIWTHFDIYAVHTKTDYYKIQIIDYYSDDGSNESGHYSLRVASEDGSGESIIDFKAYPCGNTFTNPKHSQCMKDPEQNVYTYLDLGNKKVWNMTDEESLENFDWDIAFNGTSIKLNSGTDGPGDAVGALAYRGSVFKENGDTDFDYLLDLATSDQGASLFAQEVVFKDLEYYPPEGTTRVISEEKWYKNDKAVPMEEIIAEQGGWLSFFNKKEEGTLYLRKARDNNWWIVKSGNEKSYFKFNVKEISEVVKESAIVTKVELRYSVQSESPDSVFQEDFKTWLLPTLTTKETNIEMCLNFNKKSFVECQESSWDLKFLIENQLQKNQRNWYIFTKAGAFGPIESKDISKYKTGRLN